MIAFTHDYSNIAISTGGVSAKIYADGTVGTVQYHVSSASYSVSDCEAVLWASDGDTGTPFTVKLT